MIMKLQFMQNAPSQKVLGHAKVASRTKMSESHHSRTEPFLVSEEKPLDFSSCYARAWVVALLCRNLRKPR